MTALKRASKMSNLPWKVTGFRAGNVVWQVVCATETARDRWIRNLTPAVGVDEVTVTRYVPLWRTSYVREAYT